MTKFKVGDKVRYLGTAGNVGWAQDLTKGKVYTLKRISFGSIPVFTDGVGADVSISEYRADYFELVSDKPTENQRLTDAEHSITTLESEVADLKAKVEALEKAHKSDAGISEFAETLVARLHRGETIRPRKKMSLTPNELRKAIIAEAKAFVETKTHYLQNSPKCDGGYEAKKRENPNLYGLVTQAEFVINAEKRTVVALVKYLSGEIHAKAIAKCAPDDVFNADIGKAIALGRALGLDVSRFEQAVKPTEFAEGQLTKTVHGGIYKITGVIKREGRAYTSPGSFHRTNVDEGVIILDVTETKY